jgi:AcrR family transcriptional regulator
VRGPDSVGLKDVARQAGVSHALVTHYFGTIDALIDAALATHAERQRHALVAEILEKPDAGPREWLEKWFAWVNRPATARLLAWTFMTGRIAQRDFFSRRTRGAKRVADAIEARFATGPESVKLPREDLEFAILLIMAATHGYALGKEGYWPAFGVDEVGEREDRFFLDRLASLALGMLAQARAQR